ncbi:MAG TPA: hypothetical protein VH253_02035 [Phycisphaerae bacterium]|nr:hypothetical protein [Phycisphaerae bacterium]
MKPRAPTLAFTTLSAALLLQLPPLLFLCYFVHSWNVWPTAAQARDYFLAIVLAALAASAAALAAIPLVLSPRTACSRPRAALLIPFLELFALASIIKALAAADAVYILHHIVHHDFLPYLSPKPLLDRLNPAAQLANLLLIPLLLLADRPLARWIITASASLPRYRLHRLLANAALIATTLCALLLPASLVQSRFFLPAAGGSDRAWFLPLLIALVYLALALWLLPPLLPPQPEIPASPQNPTNNAPPPPTAKRLFLSLAFLLAALCVLLLTIAHISHPIELAA